jgi:hypothetical protein
LAAIAGMLFLLAACSGESRALETQATTSPAPTTTEAQLPQVEEPPPTARSLVGTWSRIGEPLLARLGPDGKFAIDTSGLDTPFAHGTYKLDGRDIKFTNANMGACTHSDWTWRAGLTAANDPLEDELHIVFVEGGCLVPVGTEWTFARVALK